jgi:hypothetical protein
MAETILRRETVACCIAGGGPAGMAITLLRRFPLLRRIPARLVGIGFRPEHVGR